MIVSCVVVDFTKCSQSSFIISLFSLSHILSGRSTSSDEAKVDGGETADKFIVTLNARVPVSWVDAKRAGEIKLQLPVILSL